MAASVYTTKAKLAAAGLPVSSCTAGEINDLVRGASATLNALLRGLRFFPLEETVDLDGRDSPMIERGNGLPIVSVSEISVLQDRLSRRQRAYTGFGSGLWGGVQPPPMVAAAGAPRLDWPSAAWVLWPEPDALFIRAVQDLFPAGTGNMRVKGVFGFVEPGSAKAFETTLSVELTPSAAYAQLASVAGLHPRDVLVFGDTVATAPAAIAGGIGVGGATRVDIDPLEGVLGAPLPIGTKVRSWGAVPREIEKVANIMCARERARGRVWARGGSHDPGLLRRQWTDGFGFELHAPGGTSSAGNMQDVVTGIAEADRILVHYLRSVWARAA